MTRRSENYKPNAKGREILDRAWEHVQSVPYQVTARWLFYQLYQEGHYAGADKRKAYHDLFLPLLSRARHSFYQEWRPDTLNDDRREPVERGTGFDNPGEWAEAVAARMTCRLHCWEGQRYYVELWFEAAAMRAQFEYYTQDVTLRPFCGQPSIPYKWGMAKALERADLAYGLPIVVLYFGDYDPAGLTILETAERDVENWCEVPFEVVRCGLNAGDGPRYGIAENPEKPGTYQWEALPDEGARGLITGSVARYIDFDALAAIKARETEATKRFRRHMTPFAAEIAAWQSAVPESE